MQLPRKRSLFRAGVGVAAAALILAACGSSSTTPTSSTSTTTPVHPTMGGTAYWAMPPATTPTWMFPFASLAYFSVANLTEFQYLMYRPLYWFGQITTPAPTVDYQLSLADAPVWSNGDKTVTITMKGWKYSNGQTVDAQSVIFWLNMQKAEKLEWAGYAPGLFPDNVASYSTPSATSDTVTINLTSAFNPTWYLYNQLSEIDPMPQAWDVTSLTGAPGSGGCSAVSKGLMTGTSTMKACTAVWTFDTDDNGQSKSPHMSGDEATFATNPLWQVADGPWRLSAYDPSNSEATFVPNKAYSGPQKPYLSKFVELPFTSDTTEFSALEAGGTGAPQVGYIPVQDLSTNTGPVGSVGPNYANLVGKFTLDPVYDWGINYFPENFQSNTDVGGGTNAGYVFDQLYIRQALQYGIDQPAIIQAVDKGYGVPTYGPAPIYPTNTFATTAEATNPYPYNVPKAIALLKAHGWTVTPHGTDVCSKPGTASDECGANINAGAKLTFKEVYASGLAAVTTTVDEETSAWSDMGISVTATAEPFDQVIGLATACTMKEGSKCAWEMANWGGGWVYSPDYEPTGEEIFATGAGSNSGSYTDPTNDHLIRETNVSANPTIFDNWEVYLGKQLPVVWQPNPAAFMYEVSNSIGGVTPVNALLNLTPEYWYYKS